MSAVLICVSDGFTATYPDRAAFMAALADALNIEFARQKVDQLAIDDVRWSEPGGWNFRPYPIATICARPGGRAGLLTVERLCAAFGDMEKRRAMAAADRQGRLV